MAIAKKDKLIFRSKFLSATLPKVDLTKKHDLAQVVHNIVDGLFSLGEDEVLSKCVGMKVQFMRDGDNYVVAADVIFPGDKGDELT